MSDPDQVWSSFSRDPRAPESAGMRASDADREVVHQVLAEAYADGRIDRQELEARTTATQASRTLPDLVAPLEGLVPTTASPVPAPGVLPPADLQRRAEEKWAGDRREAVWGLLSVSAVAWVIWAVTTGLGGHPWPVYVMLAAALNAGRIQFQRDVLVREHRERLEKKQRKELEKRRRREDEPPEE